VELPIVIEPLPDRRGFSARLAAPFQLSAEAETAEEAQRQLAALLQHRLQQGMQVRALTVPVPSTQSLQPGWLPDDELTQEWLQHVQEYRAECDAADCARLGVAAPEETPP
jgi:hypothetical protein